MLLASNSPRRRRLLALGGWEFDTTSSDIDESLLPGEEPAAYVVRLARGKALASGDRADHAPAHGISGRLVVGADTTVVIDGEILGKPADDVEATAMLRRLRGRAHQVYTGIAVLDTATGNLQTDLCVTDVPMRAYGDEEIRAYVNTGDPLDKAGAYAIQHPGFQPVADMAGCYASVMGLPLCHLTRLFREFDLGPAADVPGACQAFLAYDCPVSASILEGQRVASRESE
jgi:septum formation protein